MAQEPKPETESPSSPSEQDLSSAAASASPSKGRGGPRKGKKGQRPRDGEKEARGDRGSGPRSGRGQGRGSRPPRDKRSSDSPLTTGLFSGLSDKHLPCRIKGCKGTFLWTGQQQLRSFGQAPPSRMCEMHAAELYDLSDKTLPCRNAPACEHTWVWKRGAQLHARQRMKGDGPLRTPSRLCEACYKKEQDLGDQQVPCRTQGCSRTWVWSKDAQLRHRAWLRRELAKLEAKAKAKESDADNASAKTAPLDAQGQPGAPAQDSSDFAAESSEALSDPAPAESARAAADADPSGPASESQASPQQDQALAPTQDAATLESPPAPDTKKKKRRKKSRRPQEGPPDRHCSACAARFARLSPVLLPCKVHGCQNEWSWDKVSQLRAWAALGTEDIEAPVKLPKRMCNRCREFCKVTTERSVPCATRGCEGQWLFKVGAQLQHVLATGGIEDPRRLCESCVKLQYQQRRAAAAAGQGERLPCATPGCEGTWLYLQGMKLEPDSGDEVPADRVCDSCRTQRGLEPREVAATPASSDGGAGEDRAGGLSDDVGAQVDLGDEPGTPAAGDADGSPAAGDADGSPAAGEAEAVKGAGGSSAAGEAEAVKGAGGSPAAGDVKAEVGSDAQVTAEPSEATVDSKPGQGTQAPSEPAS